MTIFSHIYYAHMICTSYVNPQLNSEQNYTTTTAFNPMMWSPFIAPMISIISVHSLAFPIYGRYLLASIRFTRRTKYYTNWKLLKRRWSYVMPSAWKKSQVSSKVVVSTVYIFVSAGIGYEYNFTGARSNYKINIILLYILLIKIICNDS